MEVWKDIPGFEGIYQVNDIGQVKSLERLDRRGYRRKEKKLSPFSDKSGYLRVEFNVEGKRATYGVHRLVAMAFLPNPEDKPDVNHLDGNKANNIVSNLEWATESENTQHAYDTGLIDYKGKLDDKTRAYIRKVFKPRDKEFGARALSRQFNVDHKVITRIIKEEK